jgi:S-adenosylmethionine synthetase
MQNKSIRDLMRDKPANFIEETVKLLEAKKKIVMDNRNFIFSEELNDLYKKKKD